jgi:hypothetical protein
LVRRENLDHERNFACGNPQFALKAVQIPDPYCNRWCSLARIRDLNLQPSGISRRSGAIFSTKSSCAPESHNYPLKLEWIDFRREGLSRGDKKLSLKIGRRR